MSVLVRDIVTAVSHGEAALAGESCGYLVLGAADQVQDAPRAVHVDSISVTSDGELRLDAVACSAVEAEQSLRLLLGQLLRFVRTPCPNLRRVADRAESKGLQTLVLELEAALVPVNRRAARRSLSRLVRETARSHAQLRSRAQVEEVEVAASGHSTQEFGPFEESPAAGWTGTEIIASASGRVEQVVQAFEPKQAEASWPSGAWATLMASQFVEPSPVPLEAESNSSLSEADAFDALLDECPTQVFQGMAQEQVTHQAHVEAAAQTLHKRTLTPPPPLHEAELAQFSHEVAPVEPVRESLPPRDIQHEQRNAWTSLVARPTDDPLILSPCPPMVAHVVSETETPRLLDVVASLETPMVAELAVEQLPSVPLEVPQPPLPMRRSQPFYRPRVRPRAPLAAHISLLPEAEPTPRRSPSEVEQLLNRFAPEDRLQDTLFEQLQNLSRVDLTPPAALVMSLRSRD